MGADLNARYPGDAWADAAFENFVHVADEGLGPTKNHGPDNNTQSLWSELSVGARTKNHGSGSVMPCSSSGVVQARLGHAGFREVVNQYTRGVELKHQQRREARDRLLRDLEGHHAGVPEASPHGFVLPCTPNLDAGEEKKNSSKKIRNKMNKIHALEETSSGCGAHQAVLVGASIGRTDKSGKQRPTAHACMHGRKAGDDDAHQDGVGVPLHLLPRPLNSDRKNSRNFAHARSGKQEKIASGFCVGESGSSSSDRSDDFSGAVGRKHRGDYNCDEHDERKKRRGGQTMSSQARRGRQSVAVAIASHIQCPSYRGKLQVFDDYDFLEKKGEGAFGKVMTVRHKRSNQIRACKALIIHSAQQRSLIETEINLMKQLDHPNVLRLFKCYYDGDRNIYLVLELCNGGSLFDRILYHQNKLKQAMSESQSGRYLQDVLSALGYCHARKIVHRDIKPENLLFVSRKANSTIKVIDFGLSDFMDRIEASAKVETTGGEERGKHKGKGPTNGGDANNNNNNCERKKVMPRAGTPHYMAPEMHGVGIYNTQSDLFACGIILYQMLTGIHPFFTLGKDTAETAKTNILKLTLPEGSMDFPPKVWGYVSPLAKQLTQALLEPDPSKRIRASEALSHAWFQSINCGASGKKGRIRASIFPSLVDFPKKNRLKQAVLRLLAKELSEEQIGDMKNQFLLLDTSGDGFITVDELLESARSCGAYLPENEAMNIVREIGTADFGQKIGYSDFLGAILEKRSKIDESMIWDIFLRFTDETTEVINAKSLMKALAPSRDSRVGMRLTDVGAATGVPLTNEELEQIFTDFNVHIDLPSGGREEIHFQEFVRCVI